MPEKRANGEIGDAAARAGAHLSAALTQMEAALDALAAETGDEPAAMARKAAVALAPARAALGAAAKQDAGEP